MAEAAGATCNSRTVQHTTGLDSSTPAGPAPAPNVMEAAVAEYPRCTHSMRAAGDTGQHTHLRAKRRRRSDSISAPCPPNAQ